jgi:hypothetical protein
MTFYVLIFYSFIHMCIHCLSHFSPPPTIPSFPPTPQEWSL